MNQKDYKKKFNKDVNKNNKYVKHLITRTLLSIIFVFLSIIFIKSSADNLLLYKIEMFDKSFSFTKVNNLYQKYLGNILPFDKVVKEESLAVFNETLTFEKDETFHDGSVLSVQKDYIVPTIESGIVVFIGEKENYGSTVIVQGIDGIDIWYGNITNVNVKLYDYIEKGTKLGSTIDDKLYLVFQKENEYLTFKEYYQ